LKKKSQFLNIVKSVIMEKQKHTKGEWKIENPINRLINVTAGDKGFVIASVTRDCITHFIGNTEEADANAKLIAASPELLEVSMALWKALQQEMPNIPKDKQEVLVSLLGYAERTIKKAL
jgi:hypothetical protein